MLQFFSKNKKHNSNKKIYYRWCIDHTKTDTIGLCWNVFIQSIWGRTSIRGIITSSKFGQHPNIGFWYETGLGRSRCFAILQNVPTTTTWSNNDSTRCSIEKLRKWEQIQRSFETEKKSYVKTTCEHMLILNSPFICFLFTNEAEWIP